MSLAPSYWGAACYSSRRKTTGKDRWIVDSKYRVPITPSRELSGSLNSGESARQVYIKISFS